MDDKNFINAKFHFEQGINFFQKEKYSEAENEFLKSLDIVPNRFSTISNLIKIFIKTNQPQKLKKIISINQNYYEEDDFKYGVAYSKYFDGKYKDSLEICKNLEQKKELKSSIQDLIALNFKKEKNYLNVLKIYKKRLSQNKKNFMIYFNIGCLFLELGRINQAYHYFKKSENLNPKDKRTLWNLSLCLLTQGDLKKGFDLYEHRWEKENAAQKKFVDIPKLKEISNIKDKKILVWDEQGLGDAVHFIRFVIDLSKFSSQITLVVDSKLKDIFECFSNQIKITDYKNLVIENFDYQIPICSIPKLLNISKKQEINFYEIRLKEKNLYDENFKSDKINIGLTWSGNPNYPMDEFRSINFSHFKDLLDLDFINFYKLSQSSKFDDEKKFKDFLNFFDYGNKSLLEISYLMKKLDLVISTDTSIIHLAGSLKVKSILLLNYNSEWRWFNDDKKTIWYPTVEIIKQTQFNSWENVFKTLLKRVNELKK